MANADKIVVKLLEDDPDDLKREMMDNPVIEDEFSRAYITAALWSSTDEEGEPLDNNYVPEDIAPDTMVKMLSDCTDFQAANSKLLARAGDASQNGHDFWLSRNGHGAGFFDRGYPDVIGDNLHERARKMGEVNLYVGDDGKIYS